MALPQISKAVGRRTAVAAAGSGPHLLKRLRGRQTSSWSSWSRCSAWRWATEPERL